jgi:hypothetical protein
MTSPKRSGAYPPEFLAAYQAAARSGEVPIPSGNPHALKARLWSFARALRNDGQAELADSIQVVVSPEFPGQVLLRSRSATTEAREVRAALEALGENPPSSSEAFFNSLTKE